jgi:choline dehydrogenase-like flavoprotein
MYFDRAAPYLGIAPEGYDGKLWCRAGEPDIDTALLRRCFWQYSRDADRPSDSMRFSRRFLRTRSPNVRLLHHATARNIEVNASATRVESVLLTCPEGKMAIVRPRVVVLCAGGIENARLLLCSNEVMPSGLGNARGLVGRFLMDHPRCDVADFDLMHAGSILDRLGRQCVHHASGQPVYVHGFALSRQQQEDKQLLNCAGWLDVTVADDDPISIARRLLNQSRRRLVPDIVKILSQPSSIARSARDILQRRPATRRNYTRMTLQCAVEQRPDPDSRVRLSTRKDAVGMQLAQIDWRISEQEKESIATLGRLIAQEFARIGFPPLRLAEWIVHNRLDEGIFIDIAHPIGTTRMADTPENGVVDRHCQVHGLWDVFIAGSSVFPTAGHANPTQTIAALSVRLADRLKNQVFGLVA